MSASVNTDANGSYSFTLPGGGTYTITPTLAGQAFSPTSQTVSNLSSNQVFLFDAAPRRIFEIVNRQSSKVLDVTGGSLANGTAIQQYDWLGNANQQWQLVSVGSHYVIVNVQSGKVLDVSGGSSPQALQNGATIQQWNWLDGANQQWNLVQVPGSEQYYEIVNVQSSKVLSVVDGSTANGAAIQQWDWLNGASQQWQFVPLPAAPGGGNADTGPGVNPSLATPNLYINRDYIYLNGQIVAVQH